MRILIGIPTMGSVHPLLALRCIAWAKQFPVEFYFSYKVAPVDRARNKIVEAFMRGDFTHLLFIDSDTIPEENAIDRLLSHDVPAVSGLTPIFNLEDNEQHDNCLQGSEPVGRRTGLQPIDRCGASCLLIKREVFEDLKPPYFKLVMNEANTEQLKGEDIYFTEHIAGLYADTDVICRHAKEIELT
jgi:hypothetical protein